MSSGELKEDKFYRKARFEDLHSIQVGKYFLYENDFEKYFGDDEESIILLKRVFQKEYKITRTSNGLPRVPSRAEDREQIIKLLQSYFNLLRGKIVRKRAESGDSISLRENIDGIQQIKLLIDHFEESTETFPYHMFKDYLDNREYIKSSGDINKQMREFQFNKSQNERIRNLLRQFSLLYLKDKKQNQFDIRDPGVFSERFETFMSERDLSKIPPILKDLLLLLDGKYSVVAMRDDEIRDELYNPEIVYEELDRLLKNIDEEVETQKGGAKPYLDKEKGTKGLDQQVTAVVDYILEKYKGLQDAQKQVILTKDKEYSMLDEESNKKISDLGRRLLEAEDKLTARIAENSALLAQISTLEGSIRKLEDDIERKNSSIETLTTQLKTTNDNLSRALKNKDYSESEVLRFQKLLDTEILTLNNELKRAQEEVSRLNTEKTRIQDELNELTPKLAEAIRSKEEEEAKVIRLNSEIASLRSDLSGNKAELDFLRNKRTELEQDLSGARTTSREKDQYADTLKKTIEEKDTLLKQRESFIRRTIRDKKELEANLGRLSRDLQAIKESCAALKSEKERLEAALASRNEADTSEAARLNATLLEQITALRAQLKSEATSKGEEVGALRRRINELEGDARRLQEEQIGFNTNETRLNGIIAERDATVADLTRQIGELNSSIGEKDATITSLRSQLSSNQTDSQRTDRLQADLRTVTDDKSSLVAEVATLSLQVTELERTVRELRAQLATDKSTYESRITALEDSKAQLQRDYDELKAKQPEISKKLSGLATVLATVETITNDKTRALEENERLKRDLAKKTEELRQSSLALQDITTQRDGYKQDAEDLEKANNVMRLKLDDCEKIQADLDKKKGEILSLQARIKELEALLQQQREEIKSEAKKQFNSKEVENSREKLDLIEQLRVANKNLESKIEQYDEIVEANKKLQDKIRELEDIIKNMRERSSFKPTSTASVSQRRFSPQMIEEPNVNEWLINMKKLFEEKYSYGVRKNYNFILTVTTYIADTNDLKYEDLGMMLNYIINTLGRLPPSDIIFTNIVMSDLELTVGKKISLYDLVNNLKKIAREYKLLDSSGAVLGSLMFRQSLDSDSLKKFEKIRDLKDRIDYMINKIFSIIADSNYTLVRSLFDEHLNLRKRKRQSQRGGAGDKLFEYCSKIADDSLKEFLLEEPLPFFSLITDFERDSKLDVIQSINEEYILKLFITEHLKNYFESKEMKEFYFHAKELFTKDKDSVYSYAKMFFVLQEIINTIRSDDRKIDVLRIKSKEYNSTFDFLNFKLESHEYDFYSVAKKELLNNKQIDLTFKDSSIFIALSDKDDHVYDFNKNLTLTVSNYKYKNDIYYMNDSMVYLFFILSTHFYLQSENLVDLDDYKEIEDSLERSVRKLKRFKSKNKRSIETLMKERKDFKEIK